MIKSRTRSLSNISISFPFVQQNQITSKCINHKNHRYNITCKDSNKELFDHTNDDYGDTTDNDDVIVFKSHLSDNKTNRVTLTTNPKHYDYRDVDDFVQTICSFNFFTTLTFRITVSAVSHEHILRLSLYKNL